MKSEATHARKTTGRQGLFVNDESARMAAKHGSERLLLALLRYGARDGLPRMAPEECAERLDILTAPLVKTPRTWPTYVRQKEDAWTEAQHTEAMELRRQEMSYGKIGYLIGRSPSAVASRLRHYGE